MNHLELYNSFYNQNKDKIFIDSKIEYNINQINLQKWKNSMIIASKKYDDIFLERFATIVQDNLKYISFFEFYNKCKEVCNEIIEFLKYNNICNIIYYIPESLNKSNFWTSLLMYENLRPYLTHCIFDLIDIDKIEVDKSTVFLYPDDCVYSGKQISFNISRILNIYKKYKLDVSNSIFIPLIPYISEYSASKLSNDFTSRINLYFPKSAYLFKNMKGYFESYGYDTLNTINSPDLSLDKCIIYFRHKLADNVSILYLIIRLGYVYDLKDTDFVGSLITNCENIEDSIECPEPYYKSINYTFYNNSVNNVQILKHIYYSEI